MAVWLQEAPSDPRAREAGLIAAELVGAPELVRTVETARAINTDSTLNLRLGAEHAWILVKLGIGNSRMDLLEHAAALADSLVDRYPPSRLDDSHLLAGLALVRGDPHGAARYAAYRPPSISDSDYPMQLVEESNRLQTYAASGGPADSVATLYDRVERMIATMLPPDRVSAAQHSLIASALLMAYPHLQPPMLDSLAGSVPILRAQSAHRLSDLTRVRDVLTTIEQARAGLRPADVTLDHLAAEVQLWSAVGDSTHAADLIDARLDALALLDPHELARASVAGALVKMLLLRTDLRPDSYAQLAQQSIARLRSHQLAIRSVPDS